MALSYKARRRWSLIILLIGLPAYIIIAVNIVALIDRPSLWVELLVYIGLGFLWMIPLKKVFLGIGQADPGAPERGDGEGGAR
ncbi:DUF2842 domain-containing protein [Roseovarius sp. LXJ103]|uniref:DUF2842 domain-containing protein n=1 Tax=Roseovarius carneus TaxID=2853164 RepID=UPI000D61EAB7|nr:DUF2842 domain-containing protein [Roseovarius carneus]MBZ8118881.1 DUF2842 domain-containing protein [Roseovarius carneus]PWE35457.1 DUF2842 domain-containing protein [Pelagicola sp. LXJ1103]